MQAGPTPARRTKSAHVGRNTGKGDPLETMVHDSDEGTPGADWVEQEKCGKNGGALTARGFLPLKQGEDRQAASPCRPRCTRRARGRIPRRRGSPARRPV